MPQKKQQIQPLSREPIVDTAFRMIDENDCDSFTMRKLDSELAMIRDAAMPGSPDEGDLPKWQQIVRSAYTDEAFASGIEIVIEGVRGLAAPDPCEWYTPVENDGSGGDARENSDGRTRVPGSRGGSVDDSAVDYTSSKVVH